MKTVQVKLDTRGYPILIGNGILTNAGTIIKKLSIGNDAIIITHPKIKRLYGNALTKSLVENKISVKYLQVSEGESSKSARVAFKLMEDIARYDILKKPFIIAFGGGVVGDLAGYIAAAYKRGIPYVQVPTTFLAQIDSAIGGKVAIDLPVGKNLVGAFYQPKAVISDISVLKSLSKRQVRNGYAEAIKYGIICDKKFFELLEERHESLFNIDDALLTDIVENCSRIKSQVVQKDEKETTGLRAILNFGHTAGHAIEAAGQYKVYQHGEAIGLGMRIAADISCNLGLLSLTDTKRINALITYVGLPIQIRKISLKDIFVHIKHDKKFISGKNRFVLAEKIGSVRLVEGVDWGIIKRSVRRFMEQS